MPSLRDALEAALIDDPDDLATHRAYADYLQEQGDPRGEFIQVQLALEDSDKSTEQRQALQAREQELLDQHGRDWLGILADELVGSREELRESREGAERPYDVRFFRGWLDRIALRQSSIERGSTLCGLLRIAPESRLLRELVLEYDECVAGGLADSPFLTNLRVFQVGVWLENDYLASYYEEVPDFVARLPRIEELHLLALGYDPVQLFTLRNLRNLRLLKVYCLATSYPLEELAQNPSLGNLTHLFLDPAPLRGRSGARGSLIDLAGVRAVVQSPQLQSLSHLQVRRSDLGDVGCTEIVTSGILKRLKVLDLRHGAITDAGARILSDCPDLRRLEHLDIERNGLTQTGIDALRRVLGPALRADDQQTPAELARQQYLCEGDAE